MLLCNGEFDRTLGFPMLLGHFLCIRPRRRYSYPEIVDAHSSMFPVFRQHVMQRFRRRLHETPHGFWRSDTDSPSV